ncbi:MAG: GNVR domain-containing protein [Balneolaceae bacterium]|nr:GNVR domain-containing protein [Balneolaceae bacterium]
MVADRANLETELQNVNLELETTQEAIANYEKQLEQLKPGLAQSFSEAVGPRIQNMQQELAQYERERTLIIQKNPGVLDRSTLPQRLQYLNKQIERVKGEINDLSSQLFTDSSEFVGMNSQDRAQKVAAIQENLTQLQIEKNQLESRREALRERKQEVDSSFNDLPKGMTELAKLQRDVKINEELYVNVSQQHADLSVLKQFQFGYGRIIDTGRVPSAPISPNKILILLFGVMIEESISALFITVKEFMDNSIKDVERLRTVFQPAFPLL